MVKLTTIIDGEEIIIEGTVEEIKAFQDDDNKEKGATPRLLSPEEKLDENKIDKAEENPLNLSENKTYYLKPLKSKDGEDEVSGAVTVSIDEASYLFFEENSSNMVLIYFDDIDRIEFDKDKIDNIDTEIEKLQKLEDGKYFVKGRITDFAGDSVEYENVILENNSTFMILKPTERRGENGVVRVLINFDEQDTQRVIENAELIRLEDDDKQEEVEQEDTSDFKVGDIVEILEEVSGVEKDNYGIVTGYSENYKSVFLAGYNKYGLFSKKWRHPINTLKLIKE